MGKDELNTLWLGVSFAVFLVGGGGLAFAINEHFSSNDPAKNTPLRPNGASPRTVSKTNPKSTP